MALVTSQSIPSGALTTPVPITAASSDTIDETNFGPNGCVARVITAGTITNVTVLDPGVTPSANPGTPPALAMPATGARMLPIPRSAINPATRLATITFSSLTGPVTYELYRI